MKKTIALVLLAFALLPLTASAVETPAPAVEAAPSATAPAQPDLAPALGIPSPREVSSCSDICVADFKICRDSCHTLACYFQCRDAYDECIAGC